MKIWFPTIRANSGADVYTERLASGLQKHGIDAEITWFSPRYEFFPELMRRHSIPEGIDVIHANSWNAAVFIGRGFPVVATVHHLVHDPAFRPYRSLLQAAYHGINVYVREKRAIEKSDAVISVSEYTASVVRNVFGVNSTVIPNWVEADKFCPASINTRNEKFTLLIAGNKGLRKGSDLLPALSQRLGSGFEIRIAGGLRGKTREIERANNIVDLGRLDEAKLIAEYQRCDAVLSLSRYEGFGYTALEAMASGKPFLGFNTSGITEVVVNNETGILSEIENVDKLVKYCKVLALDSARLALLGSNGLVRATNKFAEKNLIRNYIDLYGRLISAPNKY